MQLSRDDRGMTLIEVLMAVVILGIIIVPLGGALLGFFGNTDDTTRRLSESHDAQIAAAYFAQDVQAVGVRDWSSYPYRLRQSIEVDVAADAGLYPCGLAGTPAALVRFGWDDPTSATGTPTVIRVAYVLMTSGTERQLHRISCAGSASPVSDIVVVHHVDTVDPVVSCSTSCTSAPTIPGSVTMSLSVRDPGGGGAALTVTLTGQRRQT